MARKLRPNGGQDQNEAPTQPKPAVRANSGPSAPKPAAQVKGGRSAPKPAAAGSKADPNVPNSDGKTSGSTLPHDRQSPGGVLGGPREPGMESHHGESQSRQVQNTSLTWPDKTHTILLDKATHARISAAQRHVLDQPDHDRNLGTAKGLFAAYKLMTNAGVPKADAARAVLAQSGDNFASVPTHRPGAVRQAVTTGFENHLNGLNNRLPVKIVGNLVKATVATRQLGKAVATANKAHRAPKGAAAALEKVEKSGAFSGLERTLDQVKQLASGRQLRARQKAGTANETSTDQVVDAIGPAEQNGAATGPSGRIATRVGREVSSHEPGAVKQALTQGLDRHLEQQNRQLSHGASRLNLKVVVAIKRLGRAAAAANIADQDPSGAAEAISKADRSVKQAVNSFKKLVGGAREQAQGRQLRGRQVAGTATEATVDQVVGEIAPAQTQGVAAAPRVQPNAPGPGNGSFSALKGGPRTGLTKAPVGAGDRTGTSGTSTLRTTGAGVRLTLGAARDARPAPSVTRVTAPADGAARPTSFAALRGGTRSAGSSAASGAAKSTSTAGTSGASTSKSGPTNSSNSSGNTGGSTAGNANGLRPGLGGGAAGV